MQKPSAYWWAPPARACCKRKKKSATQRYQRAKTACEELIEQLDPRKG
jgi:hypothetical protein